MGQTIFSRQYAVRLISLAVSTVLFGSVLSLIIVHADVSSASKWISPPAVSVRHIGLIATTQRTPALFDNLDCTTITYRLVSDSQMRSGCFIHTAFGMMDAHTVIFNGTDEGLSLVPYSAHQILVPWPNAMDVISLNPVSTGGTSVGLYRDAMGKLRDRVDALGRLTGKELAVPPDMTLSLPSGKPLIINPQTLAFSDDGSWLAAETFSGSFVRINLGSLDLLPFAQSNGSPGGPVPLDSYVAISEDGRFVAIADNQAPQFKIYDLSTCAELPHADSVYDLPPRDCEHRDYLPDVRQRIRDLRAVSRLRFVNVALLSFDAFPRGQGGGTYELAPAANIGSLTEYIGLGDSYTSGEGAFDYLAGTDTASDTCHLSVNSYPLLLTKDLFDSVGGHSVACSGAVIEDISSTSASYKGQVRGGSSFSRLENSEPLSLESIEAGFLPGYISQQRFVKHWQPKAITVSVGGNDIGFGDILRTCVEPHISRNPGSNTCYRSYEDRLELKNLIDRTVPRWKSLYDQLASEAPGAHIYAIGYPQVALSGGNCALNVQLNRSELELASRIINYLNHDIRQAAESAGVDYIDIGRSLSGHRLCEASGYDVAVNGLTAGDDSGPSGINVLGRESYHPNALGHELMEQAIVRYLRDIARTDQTEMESSGTATDADSANSVDAAQALLADSPETGRTLYTLVPDDSMAQGVGKRGANISIHVYGAKDGLRPDNTYTLHLDGPGGLLLGRMHSDGSANVEDAFTMPSTVIPGGHTLDLLGNGSDGRPLHIVRPLYVQAGDADMDGDSVDDALDSCPGVINSGQDMDHDGIDDICDGLVVATATKKETGEHDKSKGEALYTNLGDGTPLQGAGQTATTGYTSALGSVGAETVGVHTSDSDGKIPVCTYVGLSSLLLSALLIGIFNKRRGFWLQ